ncbi:MAG TPA: hypothetical protein VH138_16770 [Vicinamibacterales bacterium]|nr:hypothetical protein [Vicinamibacterales bacterium]
MGRQHHRRHRQVLIVGVAAGILAAGLAGRALAPSTTVFIHETFDDAKLAARGWYDQVHPLLAPEGPGAAIEYKFNAGATKPTAGSPLRKKFAPSDSVYLTYRVRYSANWVGSGRPYHPHEFHFLTTLDGDWTGLSFTHLTLYVEENAGVPLVAIQDGMNVDQTKVGTNLTAATEHRAVAGCNGSADGYQDNCYKAAEGFVNEKKWKALSKLFADDKWHLVEVFVKLNSIAAGKGVNDGIVQYWLDRRLVIDHRNVLFRTAANASMQFNQFIIAPYIGDGSPAAQSFWVDDLTVASGRW